MSKTYRDAAGFSLVEVMCAILVLGIALVGLTHGISLALVSNKESEQQTAAALFAAGLIETLRAEGDLANGTTEGETGEMLPQCRWKQTVGKTEIDGLHEVDVVVENAKSGKPVFELQTLLFERPEETTSTSNKREAHKKKEGPRR